MEKLNVKIFHLNEKDFMDNVNALEKDPIDLSNFFQVNSSVHDELNKFIEDFNHDSKHFLFAQSNLFSGFNQFVYESFSEVIHGLAKVLSCDEIFLNNPPERVIQSFKHAKNLFNLEDSPRKLMSLTSDKFLKLKEDINNRIVGQTSAKKRLLLSLSKYLYSSETLPIIIAFIGPQGVGKTEMAKVIAKSLDPSSSLFREQLSMLRNDSAAQYLLGGDNTANTFSKSIQQREGNVLLLDELNLLAPQLIPTFYQIFDEGVFRDLVYSVDLKKTIIICTANYLSKQEMIENLGYPLYSRFTAVCEFNKLNEQQYIDIANKKIESKLNHLTEKYKYIIKSDEIRKLVLDEPKIFSDVRNLDHYIDDAISTLVLKSIGIVI